VSIDANMLISIFQEALYIGNIVLIRRDFERSASLPIYDVL